MGTCIELLSWGWEVDVEGWGSHSGQKLNDEVFVIHVLHHKVEAGETSVGLLEEVFVVCPSVATGGR